MTALVELKARLDEANNIAWARRLEETGVHVVYGLIGLKTHCKVALVVRREGDGIRRYVHLGTGNYNPQTARQYTDLSLFTARAGDRRGRLARCSTSSPATAEPPQWKRLAVAPFDLQAQRDRAHRPRGRARAQAGEPARIIAKMNALVDPAVIRALYARQPGGRARSTCSCAASAACGPGVPGRLRAHPRHQHRRPLPRAQPRLRLRRRRRAPRSSSPRPTGCRATSSAASR